MDVLGLIGMILVLVPLAFIVYLLFSSVLTLVSGITASIWPTKEIWCDCVTRVEHHGFFFVGVAGESFIPDRDCPKCNGTGKVDPKSPYANRPSPLRGRPPNPAIVAAATTAAASIAASVQRDHDWYDERQRWDDDRRRDDYSIH